MPARVLYTINNLQTAGMRLVVADLVRGLDRSRFTPLVAVGRRTNSPLERGLAECCEIVEMRLHLPHRPLTSLWRAARAAAGRLREIADVAHSFDYSSDWSEGLAAWLAEVPWVMEKTNLTWRERRWRLRCCFARRIVCLCSTQASLMRRHRGKLVVIPTGVELDRFGRAAPFDRSDFGLSARDVVIACVAHLVPVKGHAELLRALAAVSGEVPHLKLLLAGDGQADHARSLLHLAGELQVADRVRFLGNVVDVPGLLRACDGAILATRNEGRREAFGAAIVEAMAAGLPVIATKSGGPEDIVLPGSTGWLVDPAGWEPLAEAMREFCADPERRRRYGRAALLRARAEYGSETMVRRYEQVYESVIGRRTYAQAGLVAGAAPGSVRQRPRHGGAADLRWPGRD